MAYNTNKASVRLRRLYHADFANLIKLELQAEKPYPSNFENPEEYRKVMNRAYGRATTALRHKYPDMYQKLLKSVQLESR